MIEDFLNPLMFPSFLNEGNEIVAWAWKVGMSAFVFWFVRIRRTERRTTVEHRELKRQRFRDLMKEIENDEQNGDKSLSPVPNMEMDSATSAAFFYHELMANRKQREENRKWVEANFVDLRRDISRVGEGVARLEGRLQGPT